MAGLGSVLDNTRIQAGHDLMSGSGSEYTDGVDSGAEQSDGANRSSPTPAGPRVLFIEVGFIL